MPLFKHRSKIDKRTYPRIPFWTRVKVELLPKDRQPGHVFDELGVENLSEGGLLLQTPLECALQTPCHIYIQRNPFSDEITLEGLVVRSDPSRRGKFFDTGIAFTSLTDHQREVLKRMIAFTSSL